MSNVNDVLLPPPSKLLFKANSWQKISVDRPTIIQPTYNKSGAGSFVPRLYYTQTRQAVATAVAGEIGPEVIPSVNGGVCVLSEPGDWWIFNPNTGSNDMPALQISADNPGVIDYYTRPIVPNFHVGITDIALGVGQTLVLSPNWYRTTLTIQNVSAAASKMRVAVGNPFASATDGLVLQQFDSMSVDSGSGAQDVVTVWNLSGSPVLTGVTGLLLS